MFAILDCNNFYASCQRVFNLKLENQPVIVLSNNDGCVIARSNEAKALGIKMGDPAHFLEDLIRKHSIKVFSSNYTLYGDMSERVMMTISTLVPSMEVYSIDECFLDLTGFEKMYPDLYELGWILKQRIRRWTGIPISVGIAPTKTLAKVANKVAKKKPQYGGVVMLSHQSDIEAALKDFPVEDLWGVGRQHVKKLASLKCYNALHFSRLNEEWVKKNMTVQGLRLQMELRGKPCRSLVPEPPTKKAICTSRSFGQLTQDKEVVIEATANFAAACGRKLRKEKIACNLITVFLHTNPFREKDPQYYNTRTLNLPCATNDSRDLVKYAIIALNQIWKPGYNYKKVGVLVSGMQPEDIEQLQMFNNVDKVKAKAAMRALDTINGWYGKDKLRLAKQGFEMTFKMSQVNLSPCYTTRWPDLLKVKC